MNDNYTVLAVFDYSTAAQVVKSKLESEEIHVLLVDEVTIDSDPLISNAIGGVKLTVLNEDLEKATRIYNEIRVYKTDSNGNKIYCISCNSTRILTASPKRNNLFYMLFPFFEKRRHICNDCKTIF